MSDEQTPDPPAGDTQEERLLDVLVTIEGGLSRLRPSGQSTSHGQAVAMNLLVGCIRHFRAIVVLLEQRLVQEAQIIYRTLLTDSTTLAYLHAHQDDLEELAVRFVHSSLVREQGLIAQAQSEAPPDDAPAGVAEEWNKRIEAWSQRVSAELEATRKMAEEANIVRLRKRLPETKDMLRQLGQPLLYFNHQMSSFSSVHTSAVTLGSRTLYTSSGMQFSFEDSDPIFLGVAARNSGEALLTAHIACAYLLGWNPTPFAQVRAAMRAGFKKYSVHA